jgi:hypothetical protein
VDDGEGISNTPSSLIVAQKKPLHLHHHHHHHHRDQISLATINTMHAFTFITPAALALLTYTSAANALIPKKLIELIEGTPQQQTPTTFATVVQAEPTASVKNFDPNNYDPNDCTNPEPYLSMSCMRSINEANNADIIPCDRASDCKCAERLGEGNTPFGYTETCSGSDTIPSSCLCVALTEEGSKEITDGLIRFGEVTCMVVNEAAEAAAKLLKIGAKVSKQTELKWAGKIYKIGLDVWAHGSKMGECNNVGCTGHQFVAIDPEDMEAQLGLLDVC